MNAMNTARIRIGRVRMKGGGADVRVLPQRAPEGAVLLRARELVAAAAADKEPPSAFVGIFFWRDEREPWRGPTQIGWHTADPELPLPRLMRVAAAHLESAAPVVQAHQNVMRDLGYSVDDDPSSAA